LEPLIAHQCQPQRTNVAHLSKGSLCGCAALTNLASAAYWVADMQVPGTTTQILLEKKKR
jgi:hypothetical protein